MTFLSVYEALAKDQREKVWIKIQSAHYFLKTIVMPKIQKTTTAEPNSASPTRKITKHDPSLVLECKPHFG